MDLHSEALDIDAIPSESEKLLEGLNPEQIAVVKHHNGPLLTGAVAGAGKTASLVRRIAYLVTEHGVDPSRILAMTFSSKAAKEMTQRLGPLLMDPAARVGTFHSLAWELVRKEEPHIQHWTLDERERYRVCVKDALGYKGMDWKGADLTVVLSFIGRCKARCALPGSVEAQVEAQAFYDHAPCGQRTVMLLVEAYARAEQYRIERQLLTFDDMLLEAWRILSTDEHARCRWAARWDYVLQDEAQDENLVQREIASMLARDHRNYMVVGDPAQSIYAFRGSDPSGLLAFEKQWGATKVLMHRNYRSGDAIIRAANGILGAMKEDTHLGMQITPSRGFEGVVRGHVYDTMDEEAGGIVGAMLAKHADGDRWKNNVVLYRTNAQSRALEEALLSERIPYVVIGGTNFYERREVKDLIAYVRLAARAGGADDVRRCINTPFRFLGREFVHGLMDLVDGMTRNGGLTPDWTSIVRAYLGRSGLQARQRASADQWCSLIDSCARAIAKGGVESHTGVMIQNILDETQYIPWLTRDEGSESTENNRVSNVRELVRVAEKFSNVTDFLDYVNEQIALSKRAKIEGGDDRVTLMSIHRSKGLEWPTVYVIGMNEGILPHGRCDDENEERRLAYVAVTRARDELVVSCVREIMIGSKMTPIKPSRFLVEGGIALTDGETRAPAARVGLDMEDVARGKYGRTKADVAAVMFRSRVSSSDEG